MNVPAPLARAIARGAATLIHVPVDTRTHRHRTRKGRTHATRPRTYAVGETVTLHGAAEPVYARITHVWRSTLGRMTEDDAQDAGYVTPEGFELAWIQRYDRPWLEQQGDLMRSAGDSEADIAEGLVGFALMRYEDRWMDRQAWWLTVTPDHDRDQYLAPAAQPKGSELGYVTSPVGAIDPLPVAPKYDQRWTRGAQKRHERTKADAVEEARRLRELLDQEERLRRARAAAEQNHVGPAVRDEIRLVRKYMRDGRSTASVMGQLERVERIAYREAA